MDDEVQLTNYGSSMRRLPPQGSENIGYASDPTYVSKKSGNIYGEPPPDPVPYKGGKAKRIDYVLVRPEKSLDDIKDEEDRVAGEKKLELRRKFERALVEEEDIKLQVDSINGMNFVKLHTSFRRLCVEAEKMCLELPLHGCEIYDDGPGSCWARFQEKFLETDDEVDYVSAPYKMEFHEVYENHDNEEKFFRPAIRSFLTHHILINMDIRDNKGGDDEEDALARQGFPFLLMRGVYKDGFVMHDETADDPAELEEIEDKLAEKGEKLSKTAKLQRKESELNVPDPRRELDKAWSKFFKYQPIWKIRNYFGEKIALYFAWCGVLITSLWIPTIVGLIVFIYGLVLSVQNQGDTLILVDENGTFLSEATSVLTSSLEIVKLAFDNDATPFFALIICLWGTIFLEIWKRKNATLAYEWDVDNFEDTEPDRPEFYGIEKKPDPITNEVTWFYPMKRQLVKFMASCSVLIIMVLLVFISVAAVILYRVIMSIDYCGTMTDTECLLVTTVVSSVLNAVSIMILGKFYEKLAMILTNWENHRTQTQYDDALIIKLFAFQFANCYSSLFYIAFFRGYTWDDGMFGLGSAYQDTCGTISYNTTTINGTDVTVAVSSGSNCMSMLSFQVLTVMIIKPFPKFFKDVIMPWIMRKWRRRKMFRKTKVETDNHMAGMQLQGFMIREYQKPQLGDMTLAEYTEKVIIYGYLMLFATSFSLAPLIVLVVTLADIRVDGKRLVWLYRRPLSLIAQDIGMWYNILLFLNICGVVSNAFLVAYTSSWGADFDEVGKLWIVIVFENAVFALKFIIAVFIPDVPHRVKVAKRREKYQIEKILDEALGLKPGGSKFRPERAMGELSLLGASPPQADVLSARSEYMEDEEGPKKRRKSKKKKKKRMDEEDEDREGYGSEPEYPSMHHQPHLRHRSQAPKLEPLRPRPSKDRAQRRDSQQLGGGGGHDRGYRGHRDSMGPESLSYDRDGMSHFGRSEKFPDSEPQAPKRDKSRLRAEPRASKVRIVLPEDMSDNDDRYA